MSPDEQFEQGIQALLDGRQLEPPGGDTADDEHVETPLHIVDAIARANRVALFGEDVTLDRSMGKTWGHLELREEIGRGASGTVYRAWDTRLAREVALKLFDSDAGPRDAIEEGRLLARLKHAHIVQVIGADTHDRLAGIWMELVDGETLDDVLARDGTFGAEETVFIGLDLARALGAVHSAGLLHRDVKSRNVLRERGGRVVLMDLGAGRSADVTPLVGDEAGTPMYMAPEVLAGGPATVRSDIYGLGVVLYRLLTGTFPVTAASLHELRSAHAEGRRGSLGTLRPDLPADVAASIDRACHPDPEARYTDAAALEAGLSEALQRGLSQRAHVVAPATRAWRRWRRRVQVGAAVVGVVLLTGWGTWNSGPGRSTRRAAGLPVPPRSALYLTFNGGLGILRGRTLELAPFNPTTATVLAVSTDLGVVTMSAIPPWIPGGRFRLDGTPSGTPPRADAGLCCFSDGTTDGRFNYAPRLDSTLLEPIGSRSLAPAGLYRFSRDWSNPELLFLLEPDGLYFGVAFSAFSESFWLTRRTPGGGGSVLEEWSRDGRRLPGAVTVPGAFLSGLGVDPKDGTLWALRESYGASIRLENFDRSGRHLASFDVERPFTTNLALSDLASGLEFEWTNPS